MRLSSALAILVFAPLHVALAAHPPGEVRRLDSYTEIRFPDRVEAIGLTPDGKTLAVCFRKRVQLWSVDPPKPIGGWDIADSIHQTVRLRTDRLVLVRVDDRAAWRLDVVDIRDPAKPKPVAAVTLDEGSGFSLDESGFDLAKDAAVALVCGIELPDSEVIRAWSLKDGAEVGAARKVGGATSLAVSRSGTRVATADLLGEIVVRDLDTFADVATVEPTPDRRVVAFGPDDKSLLVRSDPAGYAIVRLDDPAASAPIPPETFAPACPVVGCRGQWVGGKADGRLVVYDPAGRKVAGEGKGDGRPVGHLAASETGPVLVSAAAGGKTVLLWPVDKLGLGERKR